MDTMQIVLGILVMFLSYPAMNEYSKYLIRNGRANDVGWVYAQLSVIALIFVLLGICVMTWEV